MDVSRWDNVLVLQTSFLGDTVLTLPLLSEIKRRFPTTKLSVLCSPLGKELLRDYPGVDEVIVDDKKGADKGWSGLWRKASLLKQKGFTMALSPHKSLRSALLLFLAGVPFRVGFRESQGWFLFQGRVKRNVKRHDVERNLSILEVFGIRPEECQCVLDWDSEPKIQESVSRLCRSLGVEPGGLIVGINPGSVWPTKRWTTQGFARVIELLKQKYPCDILLFGGPEDAALVSKVQELCGGLAVSMVGKLTLRELPAALGLCKLFITNDSGPMHIAVAKKVPTVAIFCSTTPSLGFYPYSAHAIVLQKDLPCRPCSSHGGKRCPLGTEDCIRLIEPEHVLQAVDRLLDGRRVADSVIGHRCEPEFVTV